MPHDSNATAAWDQFIDALDRAGQAGRVDDVEIPLLADVPAPGKRFGELTRAEVKQLARLGSSIGRRGDILEAMWQDLQWKRKREKQAARNAAKDARSK